ncbi:DnaJ domain-containing protein [Mesorhizobium sp. Z1-4]|uniref:DnaJ domain-containing protein n=1 Tax=Mesorhizobium sp. Z1-4 TaxID=2448478 RepID=UPI000FDC59DA|nr:DnaJ domain-containing protein [Mesorhizobium sp. Z1-4]
MSFMLYLSVAVLCAFFLALGFVRASPARVADTIRLAGPAILALLGLVLLLVGRGGVAGMLLTLAAAWYLRGRAGRRARRSPGGKSHVRTAALEMELDHETGSLEGVVLAGSLEGAELRNLSLEQLLTLRGELASDAESLQLLETYLDGRFPIWREDAQAHGSEGHAATPVSGTMTEEEAYKVLGLEPGASAAEVRKAHRRLMQRLHPDVGGSPFLAARINAAKDVLLSKHA